MKLETARSSVAAWWSQSAFGAAATTTAVEFGPDTRQAISRKVAFDVAYVSITHEPRPERKVRFSAEASRCTSRLPSPRLWSGRKRLQFAAVSAPLFGVAFRNPSKRSPPPRSATDAVPGSGLTGFHPG